LSVFLALLKFNFSQPNNSGLYYKSNYDHMTARSYCQ
jgi:hypothetical protein